MRFRRNTDMAPLSAGVAEHTIGDLVWDFDPRFGPVRQTKPGIRWSGANTYP